MVIRGTTVVAPRVRSQGWMPCFRCGVEWCDHRCAYIPGAPCRDCRDALQCEGDRAMWKRQRVTQATAA